VVSCGYVVVTKAVSDSRGACKNMLTEDQFAVGMVNTWRCGFLDRSLEGETAQAIARITTYVLPDVPIAFLPMVLFTTLHA